MIASVQSVKISNKPKTLGLTVVVILVLVVVVVTVVVVVAVVADSPEDCCLSSGTHSARPCH